MIYKFFLKFLFWIFSFLSLFIPKSKNILAFGSSHGKRFADNSRYFFVYLNSINLKGKRLIWITAKKHLLREIRKLGYESYLKISLRGLWYSARANTWVFDCYSSDINLFNDPRIRKINLWHGIPLKKIEADTQEGMKTYNAVGIKRFYKTIRSPTILQKIDTIIATSPLVKERLKKAFFLDETQIIITGYPRNDVLLDKTECYERRLLNHENAILKQMKKQKEAYNFILFYIPTFRDYKTSCSPANSLNWETLQNKLKDYNSLLFYKFHINDKSTAPFENKYENIRSIDPFLDIQFLLKYSDLLITDYSSIFYDYLLLDKPILFYPYDLMKYKTINRELYEDYNCLPGAIAPSFDELLLLIDLFLSKNEKFLKESESKIRSYKKAYHTFNDSNSSKRLFEKLFHINS